MIRPDSLIFDMDGTLWDAADTYVASWNAGFKEEGIHKTITRRDLSHMMGWEKRKVLEHILPELKEDQQEKVFRTINAFRTKLIPEMGGTLYEGIREGLENLAKKYKLFILSNCPENLIQEFMDWSKINHLITDEIAHGLNLQPKHQNMKLLKERHSLNNPVYVGDTETDSIESRKAGLPFVFLSYGFGETEDFDLRFDDFRAFTNYFMSL